MAPCQLDTNTSHLIEQLPRINSVILHLEKIGISEHTRKVYAKELIALAKKANLDNQDDVLLTIARYMKQDRKTRKDTKIPASNCYKNNLAAAYARYAKFHKITFEKPTYTPEPKDIQPPSQQRTELLIASAKMPMRLKIIISIETGLRPIQIVGTKGLTPKDIHFDTNTITSRVVKNCNQRPAMPMSETLATMLRNYITQNNIQADQPLFKGNPETYSTHFSQFKNTLAKRLNDQTLKQVRLYDLRH